MRYIRYISLYGKGNVPELKRYLMPFGDEIVVTVHNTETDEDEVVDARDLPNLGCYGFSDNVAETCYAFVTLDEKSAMLHRYASAKTTWRGALDVNLLEADVCSWNLWDTSPSSQGMGHDTLIIRVGGDIVSASGRDGSVIGKQVDFLDDVELSNLYDFLGLVCRELGMNVMAYKYVKFYSKSKSCLTTVTFDQSAEAKRFYMKMYLDVVKL